MMKSQATRYPGYIWRIREIWLILFIGIIRRVQLLPSEFLQVYVNLAAVLKSPTIWPEPHILRPERFLNEHGQLVKKEEWIPFS